MATRVKNAAMGVIRSGPIPNPGRHVPTERESNPKEILGIFINPREDAGGTKAKAKARNGMKKKKARTAKKGSTKKRASSVKKKRKPSTRRRKTTAKRAASRASNPKKKKRTVAKRKKVAKRRASTKRRTSARKTAAPKRRKRRSNPAPAAGYVARASNPTKKRKKRKSSKKRKSTKITASKLASMLRSLSKRKRNPGRKLTGRAPARRGAGASAMVSAAELKRSTLLDTSRRRDEISDAISILDEQIREAENQGLGSLAADLAIQKASLLRQEQELLGGLGLLDAAIFGADKDDKSGLGALKGAIMGAASKRRSEAAKRAAISSKFKSVGEQRNAYYAMVAIRSVLGDRGISTLAQYVPDLQKKYKMFSLDTGKKIGSTEIGADSVALVNYDEVDDQAKLLMLPPESIALAIRMLQRNYNPSGESGSPARVDLAIAMDRLHGLMGGRIENPRRGRRRKAKGRSLKKGRRRKRRASNPGKKRKRKSGKRKSSKRKGRKRRSGGRRRKNPLGGWDLIAQLGTNMPMGKKAMLAAKVGAIAAAGYGLVGLGEAISQIKLGNDSLAGMATKWSKSPAMAVTIASGVSGMITAGLLWGLGKRFSMVASNSAPALIGIGARFLHTLIDANWRDTSTTSKILRSSVGLPPTVAGYGSWSPVGGYYNFQPVMGALPAVGYQSAMAGPPRAGYTVSGGMKPGYTVSGAMKPGYTVNGYYNMAPSMNGYYNMVPQMPSKNPMGQPF